jgi:glycosyltransferase involved in cell wall biosynthesis
LGILLSVIIPAKNEEKYIKKCLESLRNAIRTAKIEADLILVDNGSKDSTREVASSMGCQIIKMPNGNISRLRNMGARKARGDILAFLDADCVVDENWILYCIEAFKNDSIGVVGTRAVPDLSKSTWVENAWYTLMSGSIRPDFPDWIGTSNFFIRKRDFQNVGGFNEKLETAEDVNLCYEIRRANKLVFLEKRIDTIHLRESKTLWELFKREFWRGKSSLRSLIKNSFSYREFFGVAVPAGNGIALVMFFYLLIMQSPFFLIPAFIVCTLPLVLMKRKRLALRLRKSEWLCFLIAMVYILARTCSFHYEIYELLIVNLRKPK